MNIWDVIARFNSDQAYVIERLKTVYGFQTSIKALDWVLNYDDVLARHRKQPIAKRYYPHGFGLDFEDEKVCIDFDLCITGRENGFDVWRLYRYCAENKLDFPLKTHDDFIEILDDLERNRALEREGDLLFLSPGTRM